jgi:hypothetical protein
MHSNLCSHSTGLSSTLLVPTGTAGNGRSRQRLLAGFLDDVLAVVAKSLTCHVRATKTATSIYSLELVEHNSQMHSNEDTIFAAK